MCSRLVIIETEKWKSIPSWSSYEASSLGRIRSIDRIVVYLNGREQFYPSVILSPWLEKGYPTVELCKGKSEKHLLQVHTLVCTAFYGEKPTGLWCRHLDGRPVNCRADNLCWGTPKENYEDSVRHGTNFLKKGRILEINDKTREILKNSAKNRWTDDKERSKQSERLKKFWKEKRRQINDTEPHKFVIRTSDCKSLT